MHTSTRSSARPGKAKRGYHPYLLSQSTRGLLSPCHSVYVPGSKKNRQREGSCYSSMGSAEARWLSQLPDRVRARLGGSRRCRTAHALPEGNCPAPARALRSAGRDGCQADKQLAPVLGSTLLDPDFSPLAQRQVIVCLSRTERLLAGSNAPGAPEAEAGRWLGEVRTYS